MTNTSQYPVTIDVWLLRYKYLTKKKKSFWKVDKLPIRSICYTTEILLAKYIDHNGSS